MVDPADVQERPIRVRRKRLGLTQVELAARAGCDQTMISAIEGGRANPSLSLAQSLAAALDCTINDLFGDAA